MHAPIHNYRSHLLTMITASLAATGTLLVFLIAGGVISFTSDFQIQALLPSAESIATRSTVTMAGVPIGYVSAVHLQGPDALLTLAIDPAHEHIPADSKAAIDLRTPVGEATVSITPGRSQRMLPNHGTLPLSQTNELVDVDQVLSTLRGATKRRAQVAIESLGHAVGPNGLQLNQLLGSASSLAVNAAPVLATLAQDKLQVAELVSNLGQVASQITGRGTAIRVLSTDLTTTFSAVASRDVALRSVLNQLPETLTQVRTTAGDLQAATAISAPVINRLALAVNGLAPAVRVLLPASEQGHAVIDELGAASPRLTRTLSALQAATAPTTATLPQLQAVLCQANPALTYLAPYSNELASLFENLGSAVNAYDNVAHIARLYIGVGTDSAFGLLPPSVATAENDVLHSGLLSKFDLLGYDPYPPAGDAGNTTIGADTVGPYDSTQSYPHITAAC